MRNPPFSAFAHNAMSIFFSFMRKIFVVGCFVCASVIFSAQTAQAQIFVPTNDFALNITAASNLTVNTNLTLKETVLDAAAYAAATAAIEVISNNIANKILSSYNAIVRDLNKELSDIVNKVEDKIGIDIGFSNSCFPELPLYQNSQYNKFKFRLSLSCSIQPIKVREFSNDFSKGGWDAYQTAVFNPQHNPFGLYVMVQNELNRQSDKAVEAEKQQLAWGKGVRALRDKVTGFIKTPAGQIQAQLDEAFSAVSRRQGQADELSEIVGSFAGSLVSTALQDGVFGEGTAFDRL